LKLLRLSIVLALPCCASVACSAILGLEAPPIPDAGSGDDATTSDASPESAVEGGPADAPSADAGTCLGLDGGSPGYHAFVGNPATDDAGSFIWNVFDTGALSTSAANYQGGTFDGRYVYFAPAAAGGLVTRYDTHGFFLYKSSWSTFDTAQLGGADGFSGAVFDSRYVYFVPQSLHGVAGVVARYDTTAAFGSVSSWSVFDTATIPTPDGGVPTVGFRSGVFDGRYVYLVPYTDGTTRQGRVARYDTQGTDAGTPVDAGAADASGAATFSTLAQWTTYDISGQNASALGYWGGAFDGRVLYLAPFDNRGPTNTGFSGLAARYQTDASLAANPSWSFFDTTALNTSGYGYFGAAFDGRYVYLVPHAQKVVARYDTTDTAPTFGHRVAWSTFDVTPWLPSDAGSGGFFGGAFDGRFVYFVPGVPGESTVVRYDTESPFGLGCAWSNYDVSRVNASAAYFQGAVFDGHYLYLAPHGTFVVRFDARTGSAMPALPEFHGSFY
jgi:hypothetical protein